MVRYVLLVLSIENLGFVEANFGPQNQSLIIIDSIHNVYINDCYFMDFVLLNPTETNIVHVEADDVYITNSKFNRNDGGAVYIHKSLSDQKHKVSLL